MPVFLKMGFSSVLEFEESPTEVVVGNSAAFQIERLGRSLVIRPTANTGATNAFVYFTKSTPRLLVLTASDEISPTYYRKVENFKPTTAIVSTHPSSNKKNSTVGLRVGRIEFPAPRDFLAIDVTVTANSIREISPRWDLARLNFRDRAIAPVKVWSARREVMRDSSVKARFIFAKPNVPADLKMVVLTLPLQDGIPLSVNVGGVNEVKR